MRMDHHDDDTGGLLAGLLALMALVGIVAVIAWIGHQL